MFHKLIILEMIGDWKREGHNHVVEIRYVWVPESRGRLKIRELLLLRKKYCQTPIWSAPCNRYLSMRYVLGVQVGLHDVDPPYRLTIPFLLIVLTTGIDPNLKIPRLGKHYPNPILAEVGDFYLMIPISARIPWFKLRSFRCRPGRHHIWFDVTFCRSVPLFPRILLPISYIVGPRGSGACGSKQLVYCSGSLYVHHFGLRFLQAAYFSFVVCDLFRSVIEVPNRQHPKQWGLNSKSWLRLCLIYCFRTDYSFHSLSLCN